MLSYRRRHVYRSNRSIVVIIGGGNLHSTRQGCSECEELWDFYFSCAVAVAAPAPEPTPIFRPVASQHGKNSGKIAKRITACAANGEFAEALEVAVQEGLLAREQVDAALAGALEADLSTYRMRIGSK